MSENCNFRKRIKRYRETTDTGDTIRKDFLGEVRMGLFRSLVALEFIFFAASFGFAQSPAPVEMPIPALTNTEAASGAAPSAPPAAPNIMVDPSLKASVEAVLAERKAADDKKAADALALGRYTNSAVPLNAVWDNGLYFRTPNKDWSIHFGGRLQFDSVWFRQPSDMKGTATSNGGVPAAASAATGGVGTLDDGTYFRRIRLRGDGTVMGNTEFVVEVNFENTNLITFDHMWVGLKDVPGLGTVRVGNLKVPFGMENYGSDYHLTMLERSSANEAFSTLFGTGIFTQNTLLDQHITYQAMFHRVQPLQFYNGADFGGGDYAATGRMTATPVYANEGASVVHVGGAYQWRRADLGRTVPSGASPATGSAFGDTQNVVRFRSRGDVRDNIGAPTSFAGDPGRFVDTGYFIADSVNSFAPEFLLIEGPFSIQSEATFASVQNATRLFASPAGPAGQSLGNPFFWGTYAEASYILTGEHRGYDRRNGMYDRIKVKNNAGWSPNGPCGWGAWQLAYRYSFLDLNDRNLNGGMLSQHTVGLNWYINDNAKLQFNYANIYRDVNAPSVGGTVHAFGVLAQYYF